MNQIVLKVQNVKKKYGDKWVIHDFSMELRKGEILGLLGPNGAGKTTIMKMILGMVKMNQGEIEILGHDLQLNYEDALKDVGAIIESPALYSDMTGEQNLYYCATVHGIKKTSDNISSIISDLDMDSYIHDKVKTYSLGMKQRLGLAIALVAEPQILILDEPTNGLDPGGIRFLRKYLQKMAQKGMSIIVSSHILAEIEMICHNVLILNKGKLIETGEVAEIVKKYIPGVHYRIKIDSYKKCRNILSREMESWVEKEDEEHILCGVNEEQFAELISTLTVAGIKIFAIERIDKMSLEDVFVRLIEEE